MAGLQTKDEYGEMATAVSLTLAILRKCKQNTWIELLASMEAADPVTVKALKFVDLSEHQQTLMGRFTPVLDMLSIKPSTVPAICPVCGFYILTSDTSPTKCLVTAGCTGKPFKVAAATASTAPPPEPAPATAPEDLEKGPVPVADDSDGFDDNFDSPPSTTLPPLDLDEDPFA